MKAIHMRRIYIRILQRENKERRKKMKFFVIGSCYSGYMFKEKLLGSYANGNIKMVYQHQHDSYIGIMSEPVAADLSKVKSMYQWDFDHFADTIFKKNIILKIYETQPDYLVIDSYAEAVCPLLKINDKTYITDNYYINSSDVSNQLNITDTLPVDDERRFELFKTYFQLFIDAVKERCPKTKFILVKAHASYELYDYKSKETSVFNYKEKTENTNKLRDKYDSYILENIEGIRCLDMTGEYYPADTLICDNFNYAISHNHYAVEYYREEYHKLVTLLIDDLLNEKRKTKYFNQAVIIRAGEDYDMLLLLAKMYKDFFYVYIHINRADIGKKFTSQQINRLRQVPNVYVMAKDEAPRGSYNELCCLIELSVMACRNQNVRYLHYVTDTQLPIRPLPEIYNYFENLDTGMSFLNLHANGDQAEMKNVAAYTYRQYYYFFNADTSDPDIMEMTDESIKIQKSQGIYREGIGEFTNTYKGVYGGSLTREAFDFCKKYSDEHPEYLEDIKFSRLKDEFFFHTILLNSDEFSGKISASARGSRIGWDWDNKAKDYAFATEESYKKLRANRNYLFIRKVGSDNKKLVEKILKDIGSGYKFGVDQPSNFNFV